VLFVCRFETSIATVRRHAGIWIRGADFLELAGRAVGLLRLCRLSICFVNRLDMLGEKAFPAYIGTDQRRVDMHNLALGDFSGDASLHTAFEDAAKARRSPALANAGKCRVVGQRLVQPKAGEPANREIDLPSRINRRS
jgi:hypothetical protein